MPLSVAAKKIRVGQEKLSEWESGRERPTFSQLRTVANVFKRPLAFFYFKDPPEDYPIPHDFRRNQTQGSLSAGLAHALRTAHFRREAVLRIQREYGEVPRRLDFRIDPQRPPEQTAGGLRASLGISLRSQFAARDSFASLRLWRESIEAKGVLVFQAAGIEVSEMRGFAITSDLAPVVVVNSKDAPTARTFSLVHELTHLLLRRHGGSICDFGHAEATDDEERLCDTVAANTLVPTDALLGQTEVQNQRDPNTWANEAFSALARRFGVSEFVVIRRLLELRRISRSRFNKHANEIRDRVYSSPGKGPVPYYRTKVSQLGRPYIRTVLSAFDDELISARDAVEYLDVRLDTFDKLAEAV